MKTINKKVKCKLVGLDSNAFFLLGHWRNKAKQQGWTQEEIKAVCDEAQSGDYNHLLCTLMDYCENGGY